MGNGFELDHDFAAAFGQTFPGAQEKRHALPPPIVDIGFNRDKGFGVGGLAEIRVIAFDRLAVDRTVIILPGHDVTFDNRTKRAQDLHLFIAYGRRIQTCRWLHRRQRQQLQHMVLHHVPQRAGIVIKSSPPLEPHGLAHGNLHMLNGIGIPKRFKQHVGKTKRH